MITIRKIQEEDNPLIANIVRTVLTEFGINRPGTAFADKTLDQLYDVYQQPRAAYYIALVDDVVAGGAGIYPLEGTDGTVCELQKMYLLPQYRGLGLARVLIEKCITTARAFEYKQCYLETMPELTQALRLYEYFGFRHLDGPIGATGHFTCSNWMLKEL